MGSEACPSSIPTLMGRSRKQSEHFRPPTGCRRRNPDLQSRICARRVGRNEECVGLAGERCQSGREVRGTDQRLTARYLCAGSAAETLRTMSLNVVAEASRVVPVPRPGLSVDEMLGDGTIRAELDRAITAFVAALSGSSMI